MKLPEFESVHGQFYVPAAVIKVGPNDIVRDLFLTVTNVEVGLKLNGAARFSFTVASAFDWQDRDFVGKGAETPIDLLGLFAFGASVEIKLGYKEPLHTKTLFKGIVTELGTSFAEAGSPALNVSGYDALYPLGLDKASRHWEKKTASDAACDVAAKNSMRATNAATDKPLDRIDQNQESDLAFIGRMAQDAKSIFYIRDGTLYFGPRSTATPQVELGWGEGLSRFAPTANLAEQITEVEVRGWSAKEGRHVVGKAKRGEEENVRDGKSGGERTAQALGKSTKVAISAPVYDQQDAEAQAKAILDKRVQGFITGEAECVGLPELVPDSRVKLTGLGQTFSRIYYVSETTHSLDSKGYRTRFKATDRAI